MSCVHLVQVCAATGAAHIPTVIGKFSCVCLHKRANRFQILLHLFGTVHSARFNGELSKKEKITNEVLAVQHSYFRRFQELTTRFFNAKVAKAERDSVFNETELTELINFIDVVDFPLQVGMQQGIHELHPILNKLRNAERLLTRWSQELFSICSSVGGGRRKRLFTLSDLVEFEFTLLKPAACLIVRPRGEIFVLCWLDLLSIWSKGHEERGTIKSSLLSMFKLNLLQPYFNTLDPKLVEDEMRTLIEMFDSMADIVNDAPPSSFSTKSSQDSYSRLNELSLGESKERQYERPVVALTPKDNLQPFAYALQIVQFESSPLIFPGKFALEWRRQLMRQRSEIVWTSIRYIYQIGIPLFYDKGQACLLSEKDVKQAITTVKTHVKDAALANYLIALFIFKFVQQRLRGYPDPGNLVWQERLFAQLLLTDPETQSAVLQQAGLLQQRVTVDFLTPVEALQWCQRFQEKNCVSPNSFILNWLSLLGMSDASSEKLTSKQMLTLLDKMEQLIALPLHASIVEDFLGNPRTIQFRDAVVSVSDCQLQIREQFSLFLRTVDMVLISRSLEKLREILHNPFLDELVCFSLLPSTSYLEALLEGPWERVFDDCYIAKNVQGITTLSHWVDKRTFECLLLPCEFMPLMRTITLTIPEQVTMDDPMVVLFNAMVQTLLPETGIEQHWPKIETIPDLREALKQCLEPAQVSPLLVHLRNCETREGEAFLLYNTLCSFKKAFREHTKVPNQPFLIFKAQTELIKEAITTRKAIELSSPKMTIMLMEEESHKLAFMVGGRTTYLVYPKNVTNLQLIPWVHLIIGRLAKDESVTK